MKAISLLGDRDVKRWHDSMARSSRLTASSHLRTLGRFCEMNHVTPASLATSAVGDVRKVSDLLQDHISNMESCGYAPGYIEKHVKTVRSWLLHFDVGVKRKLRVNNMPGCPTIRDEKVPDAAEMTAIYKMANLRGAVIISLMAKSGLRPGVIGNCTGTDGLRLGDLADYTVKDGFGCVPCRIIVRPELSKARHAYFTYCTKPFYAQLLAYLDYRRKKGEILDANSPVVCGNGFLNTARVGKCVRKIFRPRFSWRPYVLRAYFDTQLLIAESKGMMAHDFRVFFMGHKGGMESRYTVNKGILPEVLLTEMRSAFLRSEEFLEHASDPELFVRREVRNLVEDATPAELGQIVDLLKSRSTRPRRGQVH